MGKVSASTGETLNSVIWSNPGPGLEMLSNRLQALGYKVSIFRPTKARGAEPQGEVDANDFQPDTTKPHQLGIYISDSLNGGGRETRSRESEAQDVAATQKTSQRMKIEKFIYVVHHDFAIPIKGLAENSLLNPSATQRQLLEVPISIALVGNLVRSRQQEECGIVARRLESFALSLRSAISPVTRIESLCEWISSQRALENGVTAVCERAKNNFLYRWWRQTLNCLFVFCVVLTIPFLLLVWLSLYAIEGRPVTIQQLRLGKNEQTFRCWKFRTMRLGTIATGTHLINQDAITPLGDILRSSKVDELPQAVNVFRGEMNLIGYRPSLESQSEIIRGRKGRSINEENPGLTGLAQAFGVDMSSPELLIELDYMYSRFQTISMDLQIIQKTIGRRSS